MTEQAKRVETGFDSWDGGVVEGELAEMYDQWKAEREEHAAALQAAERRGVEAVLDIVADEDYNANGLLRRVTIRAKRLLSEKAEAPGAYRRAPSPVVEAVIKEAEEAVKILRSLGSATGEPAEEGKP